MTGQSARSGNASKGAPSRASSLPLALVVILVLVTASILAWTGCGSGVSLTSLTTAITVGPVPSTAAPGPTTIPTADSTTTSAAKSSFPVTLTDDLGKSVTVPAKPVRIVSSAPSNTEILFALGLGDRVVGVSSLDDYPAEVAKIAKVGDFEVSPEAVIAQNPDLVLGFIGSEDDLAVVGNTGTPVLIFNPASLDGVYSDIETIGKATGAVTEASSLVASIKADIEDVAQTAKKTSAAPRVFYALDTTLWTAGPGSFLDEMIRLANGTNVAGNIRGLAAKDYMQLAPEQLIAADPDIILLPNTAFKSIDEFTKDARFASLRAVKEGHVVLVDDVLVTRPGPRIAEGLKILAAAIHPGTF